MSEARFQALATELIDRGLLGASPAPMESISYTPPSTATAFWRSPEGDVGMPARVAAEALISGWTWTERKTRSLLSLYTEISALSPSQKTAVAGDLFGASNKWSTNLGPNRSGMFVLYLLTQLGLSAAQNTAAKVAAAAMYCQDHPFYLINPSFDLSILVDGTEPV